MTNQLNGLNKFDEGAQNSNFYTKGTKGGTFRRFQWVLDGKLARSARPYYYGSKPHTVLPHDVYFLTMQKITCVISFYQADMVNAGKNRLATAGIEFHSCPIPDYTAPNAGQVLDVANLIEQHSATLVYCGAGCGRTGTFVAGWAKLKHRPYINGLNKGSLSFLKNNFGVEIPSQAQVINKLTPNGQIIDAPMPDSDIFGGFGVPATIAGYKSGRSSGSFKLPFANFSSGSSRASWTPPAHLMPDNSFD